jgi:hypothetical protein
VVAPPAAKPPPPPSAHHPHPKLPARLDGVVYVDMGRGTAEKPAAPAPAPGK